MHGGGRERQRDTPRLRIGGIDRWEVAVASGVPVR